MQLATPTDDEALAFLETGRIPSAPSADEDARVAFARACLKSRAFKERAWPHFACFVDASNVARRRQVEIWKVNEDKAKLADLDAAVEALRKLRYVPIVVSDSNLFRLMDRPYEYKEKYTSYPHSVAERRQADNIILHALRRLPEAACLTNDRFSKPDELRDFGDVLESAEFFRHRWDDEGHVRVVARDGAPAPGALRRLARRLVAPAP